MALQGRRSARIFESEKLEAFFRSMRRAEKYQLVMEAYQEATKPLIDASKGQLIRKIKRRSRTMNLYNSLGFVPGKKNGNSDFVTARVGARKFRPHKGYHGHLIDAGTEQRQTRKGFNRGRVKATNFFTDSVRATEITVNSDLRKKMISKLEQLIEEKINL